MKKFAILVFVILILIIPTPVGFVSGSSSGGDDSPPPAGGGGGGGSPNFFDYYIPLIFTSSHPQGSSDVVLWVFQPTGLITTFAQNDFGASVSQILEPQKVIFNPDDNFGLTNGSLIRSTSPILVTVQRQTQDISEDNSFGYSILPRRMMGFEFYAPFDGYLSVISLNPDTDVRTTDPDGTFTSYNARVPLEQTTVPVKMGTYINTSFPVVGAFYSTSEGTSASMAVPKYLQGDKYYMSGDVTTPRDDEIDRSYLSITPSKPTRITFYFTDGTNTEFDIFGTTSFNLPKNLAIIESSRGHIAVNTRIKFDYGGNTRASTVQLIAIEEMRSGEIFMMPDDYSAHFSIANDYTNVNITSYNPSNQSAFLENKRIFTYFTAQSFSYNGINDSYLVAADNHMFSFINSPGHSSHPMAKSVSFLNLPLNTITSQNRSGLSATWYRIPNLAVTSVEIIPGPLEEYTGQSIRIEIIANGTLPASAFNVEITIDDEVIVEERYDFLQVNETLVFEIRRFLDIGKKLMSISVDVDTDNEVSEFSEDDNFYELELNVRRNIRLWFSVYAIIAISVFYFGYKVRKYLKERRQINRAHVDAIISIDEEDNNE